jgi:hypothetical protein
MNCDSTAEVVLYDAGTEMDQEIAIGPDTAPQQPVPDTGVADPDDRVRAIATNEYREPVGAHLRVTITPAE